VRSLGADFYAFSFHKMMGPAGLGVLWARAHLLDRLEPLVLGGNTVDAASHDGYDLAPVPARFEAGVPAVDAAAGAVAAMDYLRALDPAAVRAHVEDLNRAATEALAGLPRVSVIGPPDPADDDCDGETDEGLLNACGKCGPAPTEVCNGRDDDCDGKTDDLAACAACVASPKAIDLTSLYDNPGATFRLNPGNMIVATGTSAWVACDTYNSVVLKLVTDGAEKKAFKATGTTSSNGRASVAAWGQDALWAFVTSDIGFKTVAAARCTVTTKGPDVFAAEGNGYNADWFTSVAVHGDRAILVAQVGNEASWSWKRFEAGPSDTAFQEKGTLGWGQYARPQVRIRSDGVPVAFRSPGLSPYSGEFHVAPLEGDQAGVQACGNTGSAVFHPRSDGTFAGAWQSGDVILYGEGTDSEEWKPGVKVADGHDAGFAVGPDDAPVVTGVASFRNLFEARRRPDGTFATRTLLALPTSESILVTAVAVDEAGRAHVVASVHYSDFYGTTKNRIVHLMSCWGGD